MRKYKIIINKNGTSLEITADEYIIEDNVITFVDKFWDMTVAVFNMNSIIGFKIIEIV